MVDHITILTQLPGKGGARRAAAKTLTIDENGNWLKSSQYALGKNFAYSTIAATGINSVYEAVSKISADVYSFIIRGKIRPFVDLSKPVNRRINDRPNDPAHFQEEKRSWVCLDFDRVNIGGLEDIIFDPEEAVEDLIYRHLCKEFHDVTCVWQLSSGAGTTDPDGTLSVHLFFWLSRPMGKEELNSYLKEHAPEVDRSVLGTVQPIFIANPQFEAPFSDPLLKGIGLMEREYDELDLPTLPMPPVQLPVSKVRKTNLGRVAPGYYSKIRMLGDGPGLEGFNAVIPAAVASLVFGKHPYEIDAAAIKLQMRTDIELAPKNPNRSSADIGRYLSDEYLDECIRTASEKYAELAIEPLHEASEMSTADVRQLFQAGLNEFLTNEVMRLAA
ncbi:hypothetical protein A9Q83_11465 [Alphaproteobacteria bacterium 46_93_T64]|nr:hypothetical protein A9Q83_11465 [Alphaproteobacteria bacterium 46_93_T64]